MMKKIIFLISISMFFLISCSSNKNLGQSYYDKVADSTNYFKSQFALNPVLANAAIEKFPKHNHRVLGKKRLTAARATFDLDLLRKILADPNVDSIKFFLGRSNVRDSTYKYPIIVLQVKLKSSFINGNVSQGEKSHLQYAQYQYISARTMCPPPYDCLLKN